MCDVCPFEESGAGGDGCALARSRHSQADHLGVLEHEQQLSAAVRTLWLSSVCAAVATRCAATSAYRELPTASRRLEAHGMR